MKHLKEGLIKQRGMTGKLKWIVVLPFSEDYYAIYGNGYETAEQAPNHNILHGELLHS